MTSPGGASRCTLQICRESGNVRELAIQKVPAPGCSGNLDELLRLDRDGSRQLINLIKGLDHIPIDGDLERVTVDDDLPHQVFSDPEAITALYSKDPDQFRRLIDADAEAKDIIALRRSPVPVALDAGGVSELIARLFVGRCPAGIRRYSGGANGR